MDRSNVYVGGRLIGHVQRTQAGYWRGACYTRGFGFGAFFVVHEAIDWVLRCHAGHLIDVPPEFWGRVEGTGLATGGSQAPHIPDGIDERLLVGEM